jgi:hypothetical protein
MLLAVWFLLWFVTLDSLPLDSLPAVLHLPVSHLQACCSIWLALLVCASPQPTASLPECHQGWWQAVLHPLA